MPTGHLSHEEWLARFDEHLISERYAASTAYSHLAAAKSFLSFLISQNIDLVVAQPQDVDRYLDRALTTYAQRYKRRTPGRQWRSRHVRPIQMILRLAQGHWPRHAITQAEVYSQDICEKYARWMTDLRGFAKKTVLGRCKEARSFLGWWRRRSGQAGVAPLAVADVDQYMKERAGTLRRTGLSSMANALRNFLRWLHNSGQTERDLSAVLIGPSLYAFEGIPSALKWTDVERVLDALCHDRTPKGMRDYAIWMLLSRYGLRSGEIRAL